MDISEPHLDAVVNVVKTGIDYQLAKMKRQIRDKEEHMSDIINNPICFMNQLIGVPDRFDKTLVIRIKVEAEFR